MQKAHYTGPRFARPVLVALDLSGKLGSAMSQKADESEEIEEIDEQIFLSDILENFIDNIESLDTSLPLIMIIMSSVSEQKNKEHLEFLEENGKLIEEKGSKKRFDLDPKHFQGARKIRKKHERMRKSLDLIPRNFVVSLISEFDSFLGNVIKHFYAKKPELLNAVERQLTYADLIKFDELSDATEYILEKEIESILRKSHVEHFSILEKSLVLICEKGCNHGLNSLKLQKEEIYLCTVMA